MNITITDMYSIKTVFKGNVETFKGEKNSVFIEKENGEKKRFDFLTTYEIKTN